MDEGGEDAALQYLEEIVSDYICNVNGIPFTWHDFACIPETFLAQYGVRFHQHFAAEVDGMEEIGLKVKPILYQVIDEKSRAQDGNYRTDWDDLIDRAPDNECREYLTETRKKDEGHRNQFCLQYGLCYPYGLRTLRNLSVPQQCTLAYRKESARGKGIQLNP